MKSKTLKVFIALSVTSLMACSQNNQAAKNKKVEVSNQKYGIIKTEPHNYGGWYCPDNLNGFPAVDIANWKNVPVVNGRMATKEEAQNGTSLIYVDATKYWHAKPLDILMPKLASIYNEHSKREELIIVIQAIYVDHDSIVGFRYLNGGNGSARLNEVKFLSDNEAEMIAASKFVTQSIDIKANPEVIWEVLTNPENIATLQPVFDKENQLKADWRKTSNVNYHYSNSGSLTSSYADILFGNYYIQNDYDSLQFTEKLLLLRNEQTNATELKIVFGPYGGDFETQKNSINMWIEKVKALSEDI